MATLNEQLQLALNNKNAIKTALIAKGSSITNSTVFADYANEVNVVCLKAFNEGRYKNNLELKYTEEDLMNTKLDILNSIVSTVDSLNNIENKSEADIILTSSDIINSFTSTTPEKYKSITIAQNDLEERSYLKADKITFLGMTVNASSDTQNHGAINYTTPELEVSNVNITSAAYNVFEGSQTPNDESTLNTNITINNLTVSNPTLTHNVINIYTPANNAKITIKDSYFNINMQKTNVLRISNTSNAENVEIIFDNVTWTYENVIYAEGDIPWSGLILMQPYGSDIAFTGDNSKYATWSVKFKNCYYEDASGNKTKITSDGWNTSALVAYGWKFNGQSVSINPSEIMSFTFE